MGSWSPTAVLEAAPPGDGNLAAGLLEEGVGALVEPLPGRWRMTYRDANDRVEPALFSCSR